MYRTSGPTEGARGASKSGVLGCGQSGALEVLGSGAEIAQYMRCQAPALLEDEGVVSVAVRRSNSMPSTKKSSTALMCASIWGGKSWRRSARDLKAIVLPFLKRSDWLRYSFSNFQ